MTNLYLAAIESKHVDRVCPGQNARLKFDLKLDLGKQIKCYDPHGNKSFNIIQTGHTNKLINKDSRGRKFEELAIDNDKDTVEITLLSVTREDAGRYLCRGSHDNSTSTIFIWG